MNPHKPIMNPLLASLIHRTPIGNRSADTTRPRNRIATLGAVIACSLGVGSAIGQEAPKPDWGPDDIPSQEGRIFLVTGATSGMGFEDAKALAAAGARVILAARNPERGAEAIERIKQDVPDAQLQFEAFDLADLDSVRALGRRLNETLPRLDGLINNAAIMAPAERAESPLGLEMQFAINYAGHFVLTAELLPLLRKSDAPRVVTLASIAVHRGAIQFDDLQFAASYDPFAAYAQSKLACLMFAFELQRRSDAGAWGIQSIAAHPGVAVTELVERGPGLESEQGRQWAAMRDRGMLATAAEGALSTLYAATAPEAQGGAYYGPTGENEMSGPLGLATIPPPASDAQLSSSLWMITEELTGTRYPGPPVPALSQSETINP